MKLKNKITIMVMAIIVIIISLLTIISLKNINYKIRERNEDGLIKMAITLSCNPIIQDNIGYKDGHMLISKYVDEIRKKANVAFITVTDMDRIRYSHPNEEKIGKPFSNNNIERAILKGEVYTDEGIGSMGLTVKAFAPVYKDKKQVGVVCVGILKETIVYEYREFIKSLLPIIICIAIFGFIAARVVAKSIRKTIYGLEPEEIAFLLKERELILDNMTDGLIAVNKRGDISVINEKAKMMLNINENIISSHISNLNNKISENFINLLNDNIAIVDLEQKISKDITIISNYSTIIEGEVILGAIMTFKSMVDVSRLIEELAGVKKLNWDLRAQNHEFMNKLQTISGLIQLEEYGDALDYILEISRERKEIVQVVEQIKDSTLAALLLAKYNRASEAKIDIRIDVNSRMEKLPRGINSIEIGCIVGNVIENSIEALRGKKDGKIFISIIQKEKLYILIRNNGDKIDESSLQKIFNRGFSTKGDGRGLGLFNVIQIIEGINGSIRVESTEDETVWYIQV